MWFEFYIKIQLLISLWIYFRACSDFPLGWFTLRDFISANVSLSLVLDSPHTFRLVLIGYCTKSSYLSIASLAFNYFRCLYKYYYSVWTPRDCVFAYSLSLASGSLRARLLLILYEYRRSEYFSDSAGLRQCVSLTAELNAYCWIIRMLGIIKSL